MPMPKVGYGHLTVTFKNFPEINSLIQYIKQHRPTFSSHQLFVFSNGLSGLFGRAPPEICDVRLDFLPTQFDHSRLRARGAFISCQNYSQTMTQTLCF